MLIGLTFYMFAALVIAGAVMVITARNPVHGVLWLIFTFFNGAGLFLLTGAEFLAMVLVVVYVGAVAVLFLFVVMMLDLNTLVMREGFMQYLPLGAVIGLVLLMELILVIAGGVDATSPVIGGGAEIVAGKTNTEAIAAVLYTDYVYLFQAAGLVLLVAMIGAIMLTLRTRSGVKKQKVATQINRRPGDTLEVRKVKPGQGI